MSIEESIRKIIREENEKHREEIKEILSSLKQESATIVKPTLSVKEASAILGFGINKTYDLVQRSEYTQFPHLRDGAKIRIPHQALLNWIEQQAKQTNKNQTIIHEYD